MSRATPLGRAQALPSEKTCTAAVGRCKGVHLAAAPPGCVRFEWGQWVWACGRVGVWACGRVGGVWGSSWSGPGAKGVPAARRRRGSSCSCMRSLGSPRARPRGKGTCLTTRGACTARRAPRQGAWGVCSRSSESSSPPVEGGAACPRASVHTSLHTLAPSGTTRRACQVRTSVPR